LDKNSKVYRIINNQTKTIKICSEDLENIYVLFNVETGIVETMISLDNCIYNGAISYQLIEDNNTENNSKNIKKSSTMECFEDTCNNNMLNNSHSLIEFSSDSGWAIIENAMGGFLAGAGVSILIGVTSPESEILIATGVFIGSGIFILADSHGLFSGHATSEDILNFQIDLTILAIDPEITGVGTIVVRNAFLKVTGEELFKISELETSQEIRNFLTTMDEIRNGLMGWVRDKIEGYIFEKTYDNLTSL
jgi:hypothetical protein